MKKRNFFAVSVVFIGFIIFGGMAYADTITFGSNYGMSGRMGWIGADCVNGAKLIIDEINSQGGVNGKKIKLVVYDSKNNADTARTNFKKLIKKDKVVAICGPVTNQASQGVLPIAQKYNIPYAVVSGGIEINAKILPEYKKEGKKCYMWAMSVGCPAQTKAKVNWLKRKGHKKLGNIEPLSQLGDLSAEMYEKYCKEYGLELVKEERFDIKGMDFTTQLSKIKAAKADCIGSLASGSVAVTLVKNRDQLGMKDVPMMTSDANLSKKFIQLLGENTGNVYTVAAKIQYASILKDNDPQKKIILDFRNRFKEKYGEEPKSWFFAGVGYDSALMFIKAIEAVGTNGEKMRDWLESQTMFEGVQAFYSWSDLDHRGIGLDQIAIMRIEGDKWIVAK